MTNPIENYFHQGLEFFEAGQYQMAVDVLTRALRLSLGNLAEVLLLRGSAYAYLGEYQQALEDFNESLRRDPYIAETYNERGSLLRLQGELQAAVDDFTAAIYLDDSLYEAFYNRALAYDALEQYEAAEADLSRTIELNPGIAQAYEMRGRIRALLLDYEGAIADLKRYLRMGGGRTYDNQSEIQSFIINLRINKFLSRFVPARYLPGNRI